MAAQLSETEDELARLKAKHETLQRTSTAEMMDLRNKCSNLEDQQGDIDALMTRNPAVASEIKKAYVTGKVEIQRIMRRTEKEVESLRSALQHAEEKSGEAHGQMLELKVCNHILPQCVRSSTPAIHSSCVSHGADKVL